MVVGSFQALSNGFDACLVVFPKIGKDRRVRNESGGRRLMRSDHSRSRLMSFWPTCRDVIIVSIC